MADVTQPIQQHQATAQQQGSAAPATGPSDTQQSRQGLTGEGQRSCRLAGGLARGGRWQGREGHENRLRC